MGITAAQDDTFVASDAGLGGPWHNHVSLEVGNGWVASFNSFVRFAGVAFLAGKQIHRSDLLLWQTAQGSESPTTFQVHRVTDSNWFTTPPNTWPGPSVSDLLATPSSPAVGPSPIEDQWVRINLTDATRHWTDGTWQNYGVRLSEPTNSGAAYKQFSSSAGVYGPSMEILWSDPFQSGETPAAPTSVTPSGPVSTLTPTLSAGYDDANGESGYVAFRIYKGSELVAASPAPPPSNQLVSDPNPFSWQVPSDQLEWDTSYEIVAYAADATGHISATAAPVTFNTVEPTIITTDITTDTVWDAAHSPYIIDPTSSTNTVAVAQGVTLTLLPGTVVKLPDTERLEQAIEGGSDDTDSRHDPDRPDDLVVAELEGRVVLVQREERGARCDDERLCEADQDHGASPFPAERRTTLAPGRRMTLDVCC